MPLHPGPRGLAAAQRHQGLRGRTCGRERGCGGKRAPKARGASAADRKAQETGAYRSRKSQRKITRSAPVPDTARPGEHYVHRGVGHSDRETALAAPHRPRVRPDHPRGTQARKAVEEVAKPLRKSKGRTQKDVANIGTALRIVGRYGLPHNEAKGMAFVARLHANWPKGEAGTSPGGIALDRHATPTSSATLRSSATRSSGSRSAARQAPEGGRDVAAAQFMAQLDQLVNPIRAERGRRPSSNPRKW